MLSSSSSSSSSQFNIHERSINISNHLRIALHRFENDKKDLTKDLGSFFNPYAKVRIGFPISNVDSIEGDIVGAVLCAIEPRDGPYGGCDWRFVIEISSRYPYVAPVVSSIGPIYHPNIDMTTGKLNLNLLQNDWSPVLTLKMLIMGIVLIFIEPNMTCIVNSDCAKTLHMNKSVFYDLVQQNKNSTNSICLQHRFSDYINALMWKLAPCDLYNSKRPHVDLEQGLADHCARYDSPQVNNPDDFVPNGNLLQKFVHCRLSPTSKRPKVEHDCGFDFLTL